MDTRSPKGSPTARLGAFGTANHPDQVPKNVGPFANVPVNLLRAGLRRGELVAVRWGDIQFGRDEQDTNRFIVVEHNYVRREHTTTKSKKSRRADMSRELIGLRDKRLLDAFLKGKDDISDELVFLSPEGGILDPDNLYHRYFRPVLLKAGLPRISLHDLRHTFGSLLIQSGASIVCVKEQMGHSTIQITVDTYGYLIPGATFRSWTGWMWTSTERVSNKMQPRRNRPWRGKPRFLRNFLI
jgi:integrase